MSSVPHESSLRKPVRSEGNSAAWQWLLDLGVPADEFFAQTKPNFRSLMKYPSWPEKGRVWFCLSLHTMAFKQELAVKVVNGKQEFLTRGDIAKETGLHPAHVRRALAQLELDGRLERRPAADATDLRRGEVEIRCFALPHKANLVSLRAASRFDLGPVGDLPERLVKYLRMLRVSIPEGEQLERAKQLVTDLDKTEAELRRLLKPESVKEPRQRAVKGSRKSRHGAGTGSVKTPQGAATGSQNPPPITPPSYTQPVQSSSLVLESPKREKTTTTINTSEKIDKERVAEVMAAYCHPDAPSVQTLAVNCRALVRDITTEEVCQAIHLKGRLAARKENPTGFLMVAVANWVSGPGFQQWRAEEVERRSRLPVSEPSRYSDEEIEAAALEHERNQAKPSTA